MEFAMNRYLKPIINGKINEKNVRMLIDTGADYIFLNVPKYRIKKDENGKPIKDRFGNYQKEKLYLDTGYDKMIRDNYGSFVKNKNGDYVKTTVHGFGDVAVDCRLIILNNFSIGEYEFTDSYALLDEQGFARNQEMILGTACLRNFVLTIDYDKKTINFTPKGNSLSVRYEGITSDKESNIINGGIVLPADIYLHNYINIEDEEKDDINSIELF